MSQVNIDAGQYSQSWGNNPEDHLLHAKTGVRVLLAVVSSLFFLFIIAFLIRSQLSDWEHLSAPSYPLENPWKLTLNTVFLVLASVAMQWARLSSKQLAANPTSVAATVMLKTIAAVILAGIFTGIFIAGQLFIWTSLSELGYTVGGNPANSFFYLLTGLHGLHLLGGLVVWAVAVQRVWNNASMAELSYRIELCAIYWHYLLGLWLLLYFLLTSSPETYAALASLCGF